MRQDGRDYSELAVYAESKLSNILFTFELTRRLNKHNVLGVTSVACHPGITSTNLLAPDVSAGVLPILYAATEPDVESNDYDSPDSIVRQRCLTATRQILIVMDMTGHHLSGADASLEYDNDLLLMDHSDKVVSDP
ncbi:unnamed protein product [Peronospora belbahrii]|uniref:Uncharacterized protein n=1 Tax=Peronospora belbahrii TaxID=622444 RepID=A0AAU9L1Z7_9STRA|nr:unnamed protein product [Peronospora belbahrii]